MRMRLAIKKPMKISGSPLLIEPEWDVEDCEAMEESGTFCSKICCAGSVRRKREVSVIETVERTQSEAAWTVGHELGVVNNRGGCINTHIFEVLTHFSSNGSYPGVIWTRWFPDLKRPSKIDVVARHPGGSSSVTKRFSSGSAKSQICTNMSQSFRPGVRSWYRILGILYCIQCICFRAHSSRV